MNEIRCKTHQDIIINLSNSQKHKGIWMKKALLGLLALGLVSTSALAATEINPSKAEGLKYVGTINVVVNDGISTGYQEALSTKADEKKADYYVITSIQSEGSNNDVSVTENLFKK